MAAQDLRCPDQILIHAAGAAGDDALVYLELAVHNLLGQRGGGILQLQLPDRVLVHLVQQVGHVGLELPDGEGV